MKEGVGLEACFLLLSRHSSTLFSLSRCSKPRSPASGFRVVTSHTVPWNLTDHSSTFLPEPSAVRSFPTKRISFFRDSLKFSNVILYPHETLFFQKYLVIDVSHTGSAVYILYFILSILLLFRRKFTISSLLNDIFLTYAMLFFPHNLSLSRF